MITADTGTNQQIMMHRDPHNGLRHISRPTPLHAAADLGPGQAESDAMSPSQPQADPISLTEVLNWQAAGGCCLINDRTEDNHGGVHVHSQQTGARAAPAVSRVTISKGEGQTGTSCSTCQ